MAQHGAQLVCLHAAVAVFMHQKLRLTSARLWPRKLAGRRPAEHQHGRWHNVFRQVQQGAVLFAIFQNVPDIARTDAQALRRRYGILRRNAGVRRGKQKVSGAGPARRTAACGKGIQPLLAICTENEHHGGLGNEGLVVARFAQGLFQVAVCNVQNRVKLLIACAGRLEGRLQNGLLFLRTDFGFLECAHGFARVQLLQNFIHAL